MSDELLVRHCSPTLAGMKAGSLFPCDCPSPKALCEEIRQLNRMLVPKGLCVLPLRLKDERALIYVYRPSSLSTVLQDSTAAGILADCGYEESGVGPCVCHLCSRFRSSEDFPHEVGLFLGYPPEDVRGFIDHKACDYKCVGCWKVYGDAQAAQETFARYKKCTAAYCSQWQKGKSIEQLTVAC